MSFKGLSMSDFLSQEEAFKVADEIIAANKVEFEHDGVAKLSPSGNPLLDEFFFVQSKGKTRNWSQVEHKEMNQVAAPKSKKQIQAAGIFVEGMGLMSEGGNESEVKIEAVGLKALREEAEKLRSLAAAAAAAAEAAAAEAAAAAAAASEQQSKANISSFSGGR